jgi:enamine deaminase RidA (YjgF/YER057c/UK114 family)
MAQRRNVSSGSAYEPVVGYSRAVCTGPFVAVAGTTGSGADAAAQARDALRRIEVALKEAGATLSDVVRTRIYVTDIASWRDVAAVHAEVFGKIRRCDDGRGVGADRARVPRRDRSRRLRRLNTRC